MAGSIEKRGNSWRLIVSCGISPTGKQIKKTRTVKTSSRPKAEKELAKFIAEIEKGLFIEPAKLTFSDFVERWIRDYAETNLAPKTLFRYRQILDSRILPVLGHLKVDQIKPTHLLEFYKNLQEDGIRADGKPGGLSEKTILQHHRIISSVLNDAVQWQVIGINPATKVKPPRVTKKQIACYDEEQVFNLLDALELEPIKYKVIITIAIATGLRRGELIGLQWHDIDFKNKTIDIKRAVQYLPGQGCFTKEPKTESSRRVISVPTSVMTMLKKYKAYKAEEQFKAGDLWQGENWLFTTWDGKLMHIDTVSKWFRRFLKRHSLPPLPFHSLRHTAATLLINQGVDAKTVSARLGHDDSGFTMKTYVHAFMRVDREASEKLENNIFNKENNVKKQA